MEEHSIARALARMIDNAPVRRVYGTVTAVNAGVIEAAGLERYVTPGAVCTVTGRDGKERPGEVTAVPEGKTVLMLYRDASSIGPGCSVTPAGGGQEAAIFPSEAWRGRILNALAEPADGKDAPPPGSRAYTLAAQPPAAGARGRLGARLSLGVKALDTFTPCRAGQRMGIFAGSGVGKSVLMSMLAKYCAADIKIIGLIGERGREVKEFVEDALGEEGLKNAVVIVATGDESPLMRRRAAYVTMAAAEYFRDQGLHVLCMIDSMTRFALAQREIGLTAGEPPVARGYTPSVFGLLPALLERAGPGKEGSGEITGLFTVLVDGDDHNEPVADAVRGILDGHIVMERSIAERGRFPAVNVLKSVSRSMPHCLEPAMLETHHKARRMLAAYDDIRELVRVGAYTPGADADTDAALKLAPDIEAFLRQAPDETLTADESFAHLAALL